MIAVPLRFIGTEGHGVVYADREQADQGELARFRLARLTHPVPAQLQQLALADERLVVPEAEQAAFLSRYYPRLRRQAAVTSSDGSFTAPEISGPSLVVHAAYAQGHRVDIRWEWAYQVGGTELRAALGTGRDPFRDPEAEARVLAGIGLPAGSLGVPHEATARALPQGFTAGPFGAGPFSAGPFTAGPFHAAAQGPSGRRRPWPPRASRAPPSPCAALTPWRSPPRCCPCSMGRDDVRVELAGRVPRLP